MTLHLTLYLLTPDETRTLIAQAQAGDKSARDRLVLHNMRWVNTMILHYQHVYEMDDLLQEGAVGLLEAVDHYDLSKTGSFLAYATFWIRYRLRIWHFQHNDLHLARANHEFVLKIRKHLNDEVPPTAETFAQQEQIPLSHAKMLFSYVEMGLSIASLDAPLAVDDEITYTLKDLLADDEDVYADVLTRLDSKMEIQPFFAALTKREQHIISLLYGIGREKALSEAEAAKLLNVSRQAISLVQKSAFVRMRAVCQADQRQEVDA